MTVLRAPARRKMGRHAAASLLAAAYVVAYGGAARAQSAAHPTDHFAGGVIKPPAKVDPKMTVAPPETERMPTPVVRPPAPTGTVVVPK